MSAPYTYPVICIRCGNRFNPDLQDVDYFTESGGSLCSAGCWSDEQGEREQEEQKPQVPLPGIDDLTERDE